MSVAVPKFECKPGCHDCCGIVPFSASEMAAAQKIRPLEQWEAFQKGSWVPRAALEGFRCPFISGGGCAIYEVRPMVCRLFGAVDDKLLTCPHGCGPAKKLTAAQGRALV